MTNKAAPKVKLYELNILMSKKLNKIVIHNNYHIHFLLYEDIELLHIDGVANHIIIVSKAGSYKLKSVPARTYLMLRLFRKRGFALVNGKVMVNLELCDYLIHKDLRPTLYLKNQEQISGVDLDFFYQHLRIADIRMVFKTKRKIVKKNVLLDAYDFKYSSTNSSYN